MAGKHDVGHSKHNVVIAGPVVPRLQLGMLLVGRMDSNQSYLR